MQRRGGSRSGCNEAHLTHHKAHRQSQVILTQSLQAGVGRRPSNGAATQLALWEQQGMLPHIEASRLMVYRLLAGEVDDVTPHLNLDWQRALGLRLW